ncbi:ATP-dependent RNA helicase DbpA [Parahaliea mediterranea]|uniref:DEAD-box ATP-dependent RNA helicase RhpA n=1 Tax=Parahaliea mediterranea TaxID=651086 RepID=A0A939DDL2_9GAMM|nr:ATP-dependent RNA helicase DbpA [Parahaliea mediterranea]MBN7796104.1 ATP-dependent RNA helicase DbpA [Parahaliea mediterranea]
MADLPFSNLSLPRAQLENLERLGYRTMTPIQAAALPLAFAGRDLIARAKTGSGKTAAFSLPLLDKLNPRDFGTQALVLCPTRELATQVADEIRRLARYRQNIKVVTLCGGQSIGPQIGSLEHGAHIVVGTPGRIGDHLRKTTLNLARIKTLVLDEADRMLEMGFIDDIRAIVEHTPASRQTLLFSATYPEDIQTLSRQFQREPEQVSLESLHGEEHIEQHFFICQNNRQLEGLVTLLSHFHPQAAVVFCNTKQRVRDVTAHLAQAGINALALHGDMEQRDRDQVLIQFRQQSCSVLVATDVAARGLDIDDLPAVINFELPRNAEVYVHRVGRTGRAGKAGLALSLFADTERYKLDSIGDYTGRECAFEAIDTLAAGGDSMPPPPFATLCIAGGRKHKIRPGDILGALTGDAGIAGAAIGKIQVTDFAAYVAVERAEADKALGRLINGKIKGRKFKVRRL